MFANLKIAQKLLIGFAAIIVSFVATASFIVVSLENVDRATAHARTSKEAARAARALWHSFVAEQNAVRGFVIGQTEKMLKDIEAERTQYTVGLQQFRDLEKDPQVLATMNTVDGLVREWRSKSAEKQLTLARDPATRAQASTFVNGQFASKIQAGLDQVVAAETANDAKFSAEQDRASATVTWTLAAAGAVMVALAVLLWLLLTRSIAVPVRLLTSAMGNLVDGDTGVAIPALGRRDEIGRIAAALQVFRDAAVETRRMEQEAAEARNQADAAREVRERERAAAAAVQGEVVRQLGAGLARLSQGDLTAHLESAFAPEYEKVRTDFNAALRELQSAMQLILANTAGLRSGTQEITHAADDLARRTEQQAASLEQTAAALGEITTAVRKTAEGAEQARETVATARADAERSGNVVQDAVSAMGEIEHSAKQISQIIGVIDEIAFQTNLLALNAGVEAARAGDAGRGFAVVASEVRALAQRSADAAKEIKALISTSTQLVGRGVGLVGETGKSLSRIVTQVAEINGIVAQIAVSTTEQATGLAEVNTAINQMDQVTQQNAAMVEESTAASHALAQEAEELARLTSRFRIEAAPNAAAERGSVQPVRSRSARPSAPRRAAVVHPIGGATALATRAPVQQDEWEEF